MATNERRSGGGSGHPGVGWAALVLPGGFEFVLALAAANIALVLLGPGRWALEARLPAASFERWIAGRWTRR